MIGTRSQKLMYLSVKFVSEKDDSGRWGHRYEETGAAYLGSCGPGRVLHVT